CGCPGRARRKPVNSCWRPSSVHLPPAAGGRCRTGGHTRTLATGDSTRVASVQANVHSHDEDGAVPARHGGAEALLDEGRVARVELGSADSEAASRLWWDADAEDYHATHAGFLGADARGGDFVWCPEGLREAEARLLAPAGSLPGMRILEIGCGSAPCSRWRAAQGARPVGLDVSMRMLRYGARAMARGGPSVPLVQAGAERLPLHS